MEPRDAKDVGRCKKINKIKVVSCLCACAGLVEDGQSPGDHQAELLEDRTHWIKMNYVETWIKFNMIISGFCWISLIGSENLVVAVQHGKTGNYSLIMRCFPLQNTETSLEAIRPRQSKSCQRLISKQTIISEQSGSVSRIPTYLSSRLEANLHTIMRAAPNWLTHFFLIKWICFMTNCAEAELKWSLQRSFQTYLWQKTDFSSFLKSCTSAVCSHALVQFEVCLLHQVQNDVPVHPGRRWSTELASPFHDL